MFKMLGLACVLMWATTLGRLCSKLLCKTSRVGFVIRQTRPWGLYFKSDLSVIDELKRPSKVKKEDKGAHESQNKKTQF